MQDTFGDTAGFTALWSYGGNASGAQRWADQAGIENPVLVDEDSSLRWDYFIGNGEDAFAANPRHYVIDAEGRLAFVQTTVSPEALEQAVLDALEAAE